MLYVRHSNMDSFSLMYALKHLCLHSLCLIQSGGVIGYETVLPNVFQLNVFMIVLCVRGYSPVN